MTISTTLEVVANHILAQLPNAGRPLFVGLQGPQGSGKTFLCAQLYDYLTSPPHRMRTVLLSIDDIYLPHHRLVELATSTPINPLWQGRGQPGTHDVELGISVMNALRDGAHNVELPRFDKSLHDGQGDRLPLDGSGVIVEQPPPVDIVILEGWCVGFYPVSGGKLDRTWNGRWKEEQKMLGLSEGSFCSRNDVERINETLVGYEQLWNFFDTLIQDSPISRYSIVYDWRLEQEHYMKARNGGKGMPDEAVKGFVDRYIPGYVFFSEQPPERALIDPPKWIGKGLNVLIDEKREFRGAVTF